MIRMMAAIVVAIVLSYNGHATASQLNPNRFRSERGWVKLTAYCPCTRCCGPRAKGIAKSGVRPAAGFTVAADINVFPMGTILNVDGLGEVMVQDIGSGVRGHHLDVFHGSHASAIRFGVKRARFQVVHVPKGN